MVRPQIKLKKASNAICRVEESREGLLFYKDGSVLATSDLAGVRAAFHHCLFSCRVTFAQHPANQDHAGLMHRWSQGKLFAHAQKNT